MSMRPLLLVLGLALILFGVSAIPALPWLGWIDAGVGAVALAEFLFLRGPSSAMLRWATIPLGLVLVGSWLLSIAIHDVLWPGFWNLAFGAAMFMTSAGATPRSPSTSR